jgi:hypothetical protein
MGGVEVQFHKFLNLVVGGGVSFMLRPLYSQLVTQWIGIWVCPSVALEMSVNRKNCPGRNRTPVVHPIAELLY